CLAARERTDDRHALRSGASVSCSFSHDVRPFLSRFPQGCPRFGSLPKVFMSGGRPAAVAWPRRLGGRSKAMRHGNTGKEAGQGLTFFGRVGFPARRPIDASVSFSLIVERRRISVRRHRTARRQAAAVLRVSWNLPSSGGF